ncbi:MAG: hypothetical protein AB7I19_05530 [Planctomycetota bacterium]
MRTPLSSVASGLLWLGLPASVLAQNFVVVPPHLAVAEGDAASVVPGISTAHRQQILIDSSHLQPILGRGITALLLRRDGGHSRNEPAASASVVLRIGSSAATSLDASSDFAVNLPSPLEVYRGVVNAPAISAPSSAPTWSAADTIRIPFQVPYVHNAGTLVIDLEGQDTAMSSWWMDAATDPIVGSAMRLGSPCGLASGLSENAFVSTTELVVGRSAQFTLDAPGVVPAWLLLGLVRGSPLDLTAMGSPGCQLWVEPFSAIGAGVVPLVVPGADFTPAFAQFRTRLPSDPQLAGATIGAQWMTVEGGVLALSNATAATLASGVPTLGMAVVSGVPGFDARVQHLAVPVIGLEVQ